MDSIIQLKNTEYKKIVDKANYNKELIEEKAQKLYEKNSVYKIIVRIDTEEYEDEIHLKANGYVSDWDSKYPLLDSDKRKIVNFVENKTESLMRSSFGTEIYNLELLKKKQIKLDNIIKRNLSITVLGWLMALTMFGVVLYCA